MHVTVSSQDAEVAQRVQAALHPLCDLLARRQDQADCVLQVTSGVVIARFWAKDGTSAQVAVGVRALAAAIASGRDTLAKYADQLCTWAKRKQDTARNTRGMGLWLPA